VSGGGQSPPPRRAGDRGTGADPPLWRRSPTWFTLFQALGYYLFNFSKKGAAKGRTLREQAAELLQLKMWGIGAKTPNRNALAAGDRVLTYVGAPEYEFVGNGELATPAHDWSPAEAASYPGTFESGVTFAEAQIWEHPVPMKSILPELTLKESNPGAHFFSGVVRLRQEDYETVVAAGTGDAPTLKGPPAPPRTGASGEASADPSTLAASPIDLDLLFKTVEKLTKASKLSTALSEYDTRAEFIDKYMEALGYMELGDIQRGSPVESGNFPDYVLFVNGKPAIAIEAKKLGAQLGTKEAAQVVAYCSNLGVRWGAVTDGRFFKLYDAPVLGVGPDERLVLSVDLANYKDRDDFEARIYPELELIAKSELESGAGLERRVELEAVRELLTSSGSKTVKALRSELDSTKKIKLSSAELAELVSELLG
jgi:predicted type IV restriction endonuclease